MHSDRTLPSANNIRTHNHEHYITITEAARQANNTTGAIQRWIRDGRLTPYTIGTDRKRWIKLKDLGPAIDSAANSTRGRRFTEAELATILRPDLTTREAAIMTGRSPDVITVARRRYADRIPA